MESENRGNSPAGSEHKSYLITFFTKPWTRDDVDFLLKFLGIVAAITLFGLRECRMREKVAAEANLAQDHLVYAAIAAPHPIDQVKIYSPTSNFEPLLKGQSDPLFVGSKDTLASYFQILAQDTFSTAQLDRKFRAHRRSTQTVRLLINFWMPLQLHYSELLSKNPGLGGDTLYSALLTLLEAKVQETGMQIEVSELKDRYKSRSVGANAVIPRHAFFEDYEAMFNSYLQKCLHSRKEFVKAANTDLEIRKIYIARIDAESIFPFAL